MNDGLRAAITDGRVDFLRRPANERVPGISEDDYIARAVRAWLSLPPSEEEIEVGAKNHFESQSPGATWRQLLPADQRILRRRMSGALVASRAVRAPEAT